MVQGRKRYEANRYGKMQIKAPAVVEHQPGQ